MNAALLRVIFLVPVFGLTLALAAQWKEGRALREVVAQQTAKRSIDTPVEAPTAPTDATVSPEPAANPPIPADAEQAYCNEREQAQQRALALAKDAAVPASADDPIIAVRGQRKIYFGALMGDADYARNAAVIVRARVAADFAPLLKQLALSPEAQDKFLDLLARQELERSDIDGLADDSTTIRNARKDSQRAFRAEIRAEFGREVEQRYGEYVHWRALQLIADDLSTRLSFTSEPLQATQFNQFLSLLINTPEAPKRNRAELTDMAITQSASFLSPTQIGVLQQIQEEQLLRWKEQSRRAAARDTPTSR